MGDMENKELQQQEQQTAAGVGSTDESQPEGKTFTQEQVNKIVEERLSRQKSKYENMMKGMSPEAADLIERSNDLARREVAFEAKQTLQDMGLPAEAVGLLNLESESTMKESAALLKSIMNSSIQAHVEARLRGGRPPKEAMSIIDDDEKLVRAAFGL